MGRSDSEASESLTARSESSTATTPSPSQRRLRTGGRPSCGAKPANHDDSESGYVWELELLGRGGRQRHSAYQVTRILNSSNCQCTISESITYDLDFVNVKGIMS
jgi:hypothetical protein